MCHQLNARTQLYGKAGNSSEFYLSRAFGVAQHHDAISGVEQQHVVNDYNKQLANGRQLCHDFAAKKGGPYSHIFKIMNDGTEQHFFVWTRF